MKKRNLLFTALLVAAVMITGCSSKYANDAAYSGSAASSNYDFQSVYDDAGLSYVIMPEDGSGATESYSGSSTSTSGYAESVQDTADVGRKLIKNVNLYIETLEFEQSRAAVEALTTTFGGYIESSSVSDRSINSYGRMNRYASYVLRIPGENLDMFLNSAGDIGNITNQSLNTRDITLAYLDVESRAQSLEIQQERLLSLLEKAETVEEIISLEDRLSEVRYELEFQKSQLNNYDNLVSFSTVTIEMNEVVRVSSPEPVTVGERISTGLSDTFYDLGEWFKDFAVGFVVNLPYILIWAVIIVLIIFIITRIVKRSRARKAKKAALRAAAYARNTGSTAPAQPAQAPSAQPRDNDRTE